MDTILSLDSHYMLFDEAEKEFDIDSFLAPYFPTSLLSTNDEDTVFASPLSSPNRLEKQHTTPSNEPPQNTPQIVTESTVKESKIEDDCDKGLGSERLEENRRSLRKGLVNRPKKRRRMGLKKSEEEEETGEVSELDFLNLTLTEYEEIVTSITCGRDLLPNEKQRLTRQRRLIKNRESAQASRQRKKSYIEDLERKVNELVNENAQLKQTVSSLTSDKNHLEVLLVQQAMSGDKKNGVTLSPEVLQVLSNKNCVNLKSNNNNATVILLLILLFSFGLLFHQVVATQKSSVSVVNTDRNLEVVSKKTQKLDPLDPFLVPGPVKVVGVRTIIEEEIPKRQPNKKTTKRVTKHETSLPSRGTKRKRDNQPQPVKTKKSPSPPSAPKSTQLDVSEVSKIVRPEISNWKPNTTYLLCTNVSQIIPPLSSSLDDPDAPLMVSFLIPPDSLTGSQASPRSTSAESVLEVTCQVVDISNFPINNNRT